MKYAKARKLLKYFYRTDQEISRRREHILQTEEYLNSLRGIRGVQYSSTSTKNYKVSNPTEDSAVRVLESGQVAQSEIDTYNMEIGQLHRLHNEVERVLMDLSLNEMTIVELTYCPCIRRSENVKCDNDIAVRLNVTAHHVSNIRNKILRKVEQCNIDTKFLER